MGHASFGCRLGVSILGAQLVAESAYAQTATSTDELHEIVVTAERHEQSVLTVPSAIQAETGEQLLNTGIKDITSLRFDTPGLFTATDSGFTQIFIRGIGNAIYIGADPSVAYFVDDVPHIYGSMADNLVDVEHTEVLKGAQGGLYGRNATGGVINVITRQPTTDALKADGRIGYGEKSTFDAAGYLNLPLNDKVAFSISGERDTHDPYVTNTAKPDPLTAAMFPSGSAFGTPAQTAAFFNAGVTAPKLNDQNFWSADSKLLVKPTDNLKITLAGDFYNKLDDNGRGMVMENPALTQSLVSGLYGAVGITPNFPASLVQGSSGKFTASVGTNSYLNTEEYGQSATIVWNAPGFDLTSISAYRQQNTNIEVDEAASTISAIPITVEYAKHYFYQELRAASTFAGPLHLLGGATYLDNSLNGQTAAYLLTPLLSVGTTKIKDAVQNWSVYAQGAYDIIDRLTLIASIRYMDEKNHALFTQPVVSGSKTEEHKFIPSVTLSYGLKDGTAYVRWAEGFKTGGIDLATAPIFYPSPSDGSVFGPETVDTYETGYRQALLHRKLQVTAALFYNDYKNLQVADHSPDPAISTAVVNAKSARTYGVEGSLNWSVLRPLTVEIDAGYLNAKYKNFQFPGSTVLAAFNHNGQTMIDSPELQFSFIANLDQPINGKFRLVGSLLESHTSSVIYQYSSLPGVIPDLQVPGYWLTNARIGVKTADDKYGLFLVADNLFNQVYFVSGSSVTFGNEDIFGNPRIIRGEISARY